MGFKLKSGNKVSFKHMGSSPAKQSAYAREKKAQMQNASDRIDLEDKQFEADVRKGAQAKKHRINAITGTPLFEKEEEAKEAKTKVNINQKSKTDKQKARGGDTPGGRRVTREERNMLKDSKLNEQLERANTLEAAGKGEKGFSWKEAGMSVLRGEGLLGNIASGMGKGRDMSDIIKDKQLKVAGRRERKDLRKSQRAQRKTDRKARLKKNIDLTDI